MEVLLNTLIGSRGNQTTVGVMKIVGKLDISLVTCGMTRIVITSGARFVN